MTTKHASAMPKWNTMARGCLVYSWALRYQLHRKNRCLGPPGFARWPQWSSKDLRNLASIRASARACHARLGGRKVRDPWYEDGVRTSHRIKSINNVIPQSRKQLWADTMTREKTRPLAVAESGRPKMTNNVLSLHSGWEPNIGARTHRNKAKTVAMKTGGSALIRIVHQPRSNSRAVFPFTGSAGLALGLDECIEAAAA
jgi:hypothetical protein